MPALLSDVDVELLLLAIKNLDGYFKYAKRELLKKVVMQCGL